ncbi:MAG: cupin domain-containing protein [Actinomycetes bacterium]
MRTSVRAALTATAVATTLALGSAAWAEAGGTGVTRGAPIGATGASTTTLPVAGSVVRAKGITRTVLSVSRPANAPGQVLYLTRVRIAPKSRLTEHFHDGTQIASVQSGVLSYRITSGTVTITGRNGTVRTVTGPRTVRIRAGESLVESAGLTHYGSNATSKPVVILTAALIAEGAGLSTPVGTGATGTEIAIAADLSVTENRLLSLETPAGTRLIGTAVETAGATVGAGPAKGQAVRVSLAEQVTYVNGAGPWSAILTLTFGDGSQILGSVAGATVPTGEGATFAGTIEVLAGTGRYSAVTGGTGTYTGGRTGVLGASALPTQITLRVAGL